jgi:hypothetical protein
MIAYKGQLANELSDYVDEQPWAGQKMVGPCLSKGKDALYICIGAGLVIARPVGSDYPAHVTTALVSLRTGSLADVAPT